MQFVKQVAPTVEDLTARRVAGRPAGRRLPDRLLGRRVPRLPRVRAGAPGRGRPGDAGRPGRAWSLVDRQAVLGQGLVRAVWTDDMAPSDPDQPASRALHRAGRAGAGDPGGPGGAQERRPGHRDGQARPRGALASASGNEDTAKLLAKVVDVVDPATGTVRLKRKVADADEMTLDTRSTKTVRTRTGASKDEGSPHASLPCRP